MSGQFEKFWKELERDEKAELAEKADTSVAYLSQVASGHRGAGNKTINSLLGADSRISLSWFFEAA